MDETHIEHHPIHHKRHHHSHSDRKHWKHKPDPYRPNYLPHHHPHQHHNHPPSRRDYRKAYSRPQPNRPKHECERKCRRGDRRTCVYRWNIHLARVMGLECGNCPDNIKDCLKNGCITAGGDRRALYIVNFGFPGPTISVCKNDVVVVKVRNRLDQSEAVTIHWHGIHQRNTQWMDGVPMVTQCGIFAQTTFRYAFKAYPQGTHFWHAHSGFLSSDGVAGPLIVREADDPHYVRRHYNYDNCMEHVMFMQEWMPIMTKSKFTETHPMRADSKGDQHVTKRRLQRRRIKKNLVAWYFNNFIENSRYKPKAVKESIRPTETILINGRSSGSSSSLPLSDFRVRKGYRYRFRVIYHGITSCPLTLSIDRHCFDIIALDGQPIKRIDCVGKLKLQAGERVDFIVHADQEVGNYWIHANAAIDCEGLFGLAVLHYKGAPHVPFHGVPDPMVQTNNKTFNVFKGRSDENNIYVSDASALFPQKRTRGKPYRLFLRSDLVRLPSTRKGVDDPHWWPLHSRLINGHRYLPQLDGVSYKMPSFPMLSQWSQIPRHQFCHHKKYRRCPPKFCKCVNIKKIPFKRYIDLVIYDGFSFFPVSHPIHFHGYLFQVLQSGILGRNNTVDLVKKQLDDERLDARSVIAPFKDTVAIPAGGYVVLRFYSDNPGPWLLHCHVAFHFENGMALVLTVGRPSIWPRVPGNFPRCGNFK